MEVIEVKEEKQTKVVREVASLDFQSSKLIAMGLREAFFAKHSIELQPALELLRSLPETKTFHNLDHTHTVVESIMILWAKEHNVALKDILKTENKTLCELLLAGVYHDTGHLEGAKDHELRGVTFMKANLAKFYDDSTLENIAGRIMATRMELTPEGKFCQVPARDKYDAIIQDADLSNLGGVNFKKQYEVSSGLFQEIIGTIDGVKYYNSAAFIDEQIKFFADHEYRTESGKKLLNDGKAKNLAGLELVSLRNMLTLATI